MDLNARDIFNQPRQEVWNIPKGLHNVAYEDGVVVVESEKDLVLNRYAWEIMQLFPNTPLMSESSVKVMLGDNNFDSNTIPKLLEAIFRQVCVSNNIHYYKDKEPLLRLAYQTSNWIFNEVVHRISPNVTTIDAVDFIDLVNDKEIKQLHKDLEPSIRSVESTYTGIKSYIKASPVTNRLAAAYKSKAVNDNQANQCVGPRGFVTDLDRTVFRQPIMNGYIRGMGDLFELLAESRTAAKSLNAQESHVRISEYASRRVQLLTMTVAETEPGDCGSTEYMDMLMTPKRLRNMKGIYYLDPGTDTLRYLDGTEEHLSEQIIKIRTPFGCKHPVENKVCSVCLGKISENLKENSNLGYTMTSFLMEKLTQSILSTKHLIRSVRKTVIQLEGMAVKYFNIKNGDEYYLNKNLDLTNLDIILPGNRMGRLTDILSLQHTNVSLTRAGELDAVSIRDSSKKTPFTESVSISYRDRESVITKEFLDYIKKTPFETDARGNFIIPLAGYDKREPIFVTPLKEDNVLAFVNKIADVIEKTKTLKGKPVCPYNKYIELFDMVLERFECNLTVVGVMIYSITAKNALEGDFSLGRNSVNTSCVDAATLFRSRSVSQLLVYERQTPELIKKPMGLFSDGKRTDHPFDVLFIPNEMLGNS